MKYRRTKYLIDKSFQMKILLIFLVIAFFGSIIALSVFHYYISKELDTYLWSVHIPAESTGEFLKPLFLKISVFGFVFMSLLIVTCAIWLIKRASGSLYRISSDIHAAAKGDLTKKITLRQGDDFRELAHDLNAMLHNIREIVGKLNEKYTAISQKLQDLKEGHYDEDSCNSVLAEIEFIEADLRKLELQNPQ